MICFALAPPRPARLARIGLLALVGLAGAACGSSSSPDPTPPPVSGYKGYDPAHDLGPLFQDVQLASVFPDSKTFVDARALSAPADIAAAYVKAKAAGPVDLVAFVQANFEPPADPTAGPPSDPTQAMEDHIRGLWPVLTRPADKADAQSSLIPIPEPYVVPGGRFREVYYWDSYFTMEGLVASGDTDLVKNMLDDFAYLITTTGHMPNGTRTYYLGRSQPPYFGAMIALYADTAGVAQAVPYLDALEAEHAFWMEGGDALAPGEAHRRVVRMSDGSLLNRYWDDFAEPRPESYREDFTLVQGLAADAQTDVYRNIRATAESGWDFSSRWLRDPTDLKTLETTDLVPIDLNALLYKAELTIAQLRTARGKPGDADVAAQYTAMADARKTALTTAAFDPTAGYFFDVRWKTGERVTDRPTMAAAAMLYFGLASPDQGAAVATVLERDFLQPGGFVTTKITSGQQWDAPNGWPPLQWLAINGLASYQRADLATEATTRWLALNRKTYAATGKMTEKYDVIDLTKPAGGGEYPTQDGFGWTNGVAISLSTDQQP
jgi:alpha,alpha-trehalase